MLACVKVIADGCATPNLSVFRELPDGTRQKAARQHSGHLQRGLVSDSNPGDLAPAHAVDQVCHLVIGELGSFAAQESVKEFQDVVSQKDFSVDC